MTTATPARIARCNREAEYALVQDATVQAQRPDARPTGQDDAVIDSFWDSTAHAQLMLAEKFAILSQERMSEAAELADPIRIGTDLPISPLVPYVRMRDPERGLDRRMLLTGIAVDQNTDRNSIEATG